MSEEKEPTITIQDPWIGKREIGPGYLNLIRDQLKVLLHFKNDGRKPSDHLLEDIKVYEYISEHPNGEEVATAYMKKMNQLRDERGSLGIKKMEVAKALGWFQ